MSLLTQLVPLFPVVINFKRLKAFALAASFNKNRTEIHFATLFEVEFRDVNGTRNGGAVGGGTAGAQTGTMHLGERLKRRE